MNMLLRRIERIEAERQGHLGRKIVTFDDWGDAAELESHMRMVRQLEAEGFVVLNIIRQHVHEVIVPMPGDVVIQRGYSR
jgi:hypothetical protein